jgi:hypothetical protein
LVSAGPAVATKEEMGNLIRNLTTKEPVDRLVYMLEEFSQNFTEGIYQAHKKREGLTKALF